VLFGKSSYRFGERWAVDRHQILADRMGPGEFRKPIYDLMFTKRAEGMGFVNSKSDAFLGLNK
jgi:hypothetical protein